MNRLKVYSVHPAKRWVGTDKGRGGWKSEIRLKRWI